MTHEKKKRTDTSERGMGDDSDTVAPVPVLRNHKSRPNTPRPAIPDSKDQGVQRPDRGLGELAARMAALYRSNERSVGRFNPASGKMTTDHESHSTSDFKRHLAGEFGVGLVPILDDGTCSWAAIDIDNHGSEEDIPIGPIDVKLVGAGIPAIPCRSKSGGVHVYFFFEKPWSAARAKSLLARIAEEIRHPGSEIFPKQFKLVGKQLGNWINLPYLGGDSTVRYAYRNGKKLTVTEFLDLAESLKITDKYAGDRVRAEHTEAPPCVQAMMAEGVDKGQRNESMYMVSVYLRKSHPDNYAELARGINDMMFDQPLPRNELTRTVNSAARPDYRYRCNEEPQKTLCDRAACLKRKYGITPADAEVDATLSELPEFTNLIKYQTDPVRWEIWVNACPVTNIETEDLLDWRFMRRVIAERLTRVVPMIKNQEWERILQPLMQDARVVEAPEDASTTGLIRSRFKEFAAKAADLRGRPERVEDRQALLRGLPIIVKIDGEQQIAFRSQDFVQYLKRTKSEELRGINLWFAIRELGLRTTRVRVSKERSINVWFLPLAVVESSAIEGPEFKVEL